MPAARKPVSGSYRVADRGLDSTMRMLTNASGKEWFVGDAVDPNDLAPGDLDWLLEAGVIEKVGD